MKKNLAKSQDPALYLVTGQAETKDDEVIESAIKILMRRMKKTGQLFARPEDVKNYLRLKTGALPHEVFSVLFLDSQHRLIAAEEMFRGTLTQCSVYPREVVTQAIAHGACSVVLSHNHPSGSTTPSRADEVLTQTLKTALALVDVRVIDHVIVSAEGAYSMAEGGLL